MPIDFGLAIGIGALGAAVGAGISALAAGIGLSKIAAGAAESIARQPQAAGDIRGGSLLLGFLVEGVCLFACVIAFMANGSITGGITAAYDGEIKVMEKQYELSQPVTGSIIDDDVDDVVEGRPSDLPD